MTRPRDAGSANGEVADGASNPKQACASTRRDGRPCAARALPGDTRCWAHSPATADRREEARRRGGQHRATAHRARVPEPIGDVLDGLGAVFAETRSGAFDPGRARACAAVARALVAAWDSCIAEERMEDLERRMDLLTGRGVR